MSRSGKKLSTFEFERQNIAGCCKQTFCFQCNMKLIKAKYDYLSFLSGVANWAQKFKFPYTTGSWHQSLHHLLNLFRTLKGRILAEMKNSVTKSYFSSHIEMGGHFGVRHEGWILEIRYKVKSFCQTVFKKKTL